MAHALGMWKDRKTLACSRVCLLSAVLVGALFYQGSELFVALAPSGLPMKRLEAVSLSRAAQQAEGGEAITFETLTIGSEVKGIVTKVNPLSVDLDIGVPGVNMANLHVARFCKDRVEKAADVLAVGDELSVAVFACKPGRKYLTLASLDHPNFKKRLLQSFSVGERLTGTLTGKTSRYAFFEVGCMATAVTPVELLGDISEGDAMEVTVTKVGQWSLELEPAYMRHFQRLRRDYPGIRIMILHIVADREEVLQRAKERGEKTGRVVPVELLEESMEQVPKSVDALAAEADFACRVVNRSGVEPYLERVGSAPCPPKEIDLSWDLVKSLWKDIDTDHDGKLSKLEVATAISQGILTQKVLDTIDGDRDGSISYEEVRKAQEAARAAATRNYK